MVVIFHVWTFLSVLLIINYTSIQIVSTISELHNTNFKRPKDLKSHLSKIQHCEGSSAIQILPSALFNCMVFMHGQKDV